jgi:hypothetical protein
VEAVGPIRSLYDAIWYGGIAMMFLLALWGSWAGVWRWGKDCRKVEQERDYWRDAFFEATNLSKYVIEGRRRG